MTRESAKGRITFIADGNFGFKRFSNHAGKIGDSFLKTSFYVKKSGLIYPAFSRAEAECSEFRSGDELTKKAGACDVSGLYVSISSHSILYKCIDIEKGESLSLGTEILDNLRSDLCENFGTKLNFGYDISCSLKPFLKNRSLDHLFPAIFFIPEMHAKSHRQSCQLDTVPYFLLRMGMEDGEIVKSQSVCSWKDALE